MPLKSPGLKKLLSETASSWSRHGSTTEAAALAFYTMFSLAPVLIVIVTVAGAFFGEQAVRGQIVRQFQELMGRQQAEAVQEILKKVATSEGRGWAGVLGILTLLFGTTGVFVQLQESLNRIWEVAPERGALWRTLLRKRFVSFALVFGLGFLLMVSLTLSAALTALKENIQAHFSIPAWMLETENLVISFLVFAILIAMIYRILPDAKIEWRDVWLGSVVTSILFSIGKWLIGLYLGRTAIGSAYGAAGSLVMILSWVYYTSLILLFGAEFTHAYSRAIRPVPVQPEPGAKRIAPASGDVELQAG